MHIAVTEAPITNLRGKCTTCMCGVQGYCLCETAPWVSGYMLILQATNAAEATPYLS